jgi:hypothetical protein
MGVSELAQEAQVAREVGGHGRDGAALDPDDQDPAGDGRRSQPPVGPAREPQQCAFASPADQDQGRAGTPHAKPGASEGLTTGGPPGPGRLQGGILGSIRTSPATQPSHPSPGRPSAGVSPAQALGLGPLLSPLGMLPGLRLLGSLERIRVLGVRVGQMRRVPSPIQRCRHQPDRARWGHSGPRHASPCELSSCRTPAWSPRSVQALPRPMPDSTEQTMAKAHPKRVMTATGLAATVRSTG